MTGVTIVAGSAPNAIEMAVDTVNAGGVIAMPTDTVYGLAASLRDPAALDLIFAIKGRPLDLTLPILLSSPDGVRHIADNPDSDVLLLLDRYWPGPLTVAVPATQQLPRHVRASDGTVGLRVPNHPLAIEIIERCDGAIACTSANVSGQAPALSVDDLMEGVGDRLDLIVDGGTSPGGVASTVIRLDETGLHILREGAIPGEHLLAFWHDLKRGA